MQVVIARVGDYTIRACGRDDITRVIEINARTLPEHYSDYFYHEILAEFPETFLVVELNGQVVGYVMCRIEYGFSHLRRLGLARKGHVVSVAVIEEHRGKGLGTRLIQTAHAEMVKKSATECYLEVRVSNVQAAELYKRLGYKVCGKLDSYYRDGEAAYLMAAPLGS